jgi:hypothetical protein
MTMSTSDDRDGSRERLVGLGAALLLPLAGIGACAGRFEAGLANAPSIESPTPPTGHHDVIANAERQGQGEGQGEVFDDAGHPVLDASPDAAYASHRVP